MEELFREWTGWAALAVEAAAVLVVAIAAGEALLGTLRIWILRPALPDAAREGVRLHLVRSLALALEFALAADILRTAISPNWEEIGKLAAIATLRTALNFFLQKEIETAARHDLRAAAAGAPQEPSPRG